MTYRENARDLTGEVESLAERVAKLEEKPAKEPSKPWTNREMARLSLASAVALFVLSGLAPSVFSGFWPLAIGAGAAGLLMAIAAAVFGDSGNP